MSGPAEMTYGQAKEHFASSRAVLCLGDALVLLLTDELKWCHGGGLTLGGQIVTFEGHPLPSYRITIEPDGTIVEEVWGYDSQTPPHAVIRFPPLGDDVFDPLAERHAARRASAQATS